MAIFEVQGVVSADTGEPLVQLRQVDEEGGMKFGFQLSPMDAREVAQNIQEAATNAIYEAALISWAKERDPQSGEAMGAMMIGGIRKHRADKWGLPSNPDDWRVDKPDE